MQICGFQKTTFIDYPGKIAALIFTGGCDFRCPYCHNGALVLYPNKHKVILEGEVLSHLKKRKNLIEALVITGGEPTLQKDLEIFIQKVKTLGFLVKLDTNGMRPNVLENLIKKQCLDYVAMDIKHDFKRYDQAIGISTTDKFALKRSIQLILDSGLDHEFRSTLLKGLHDQKSICNMAEAISGAKHYVLQQYRSGENELATHNYIPFTKQEMETFLKHETIQKHILKTSVRATY